MSAEQQEQNARQRQLAGTRQLNAEAGVDVAKFVPVHAYSDWVKGRINHHDGKDLTIALLGLAGEVGELFEHFKKNLDRGRPIDREAIVLELGDILFYLVAVAELNGISLQEIIRGNLEKLIARDGVHNERYHERR